MLSRTERNTMLNETKIFESKAFGDSRTLWVSSTSTGSVSMQTLCIIAGVESWEELATYAAGEGATIESTYSTMRIVPSDTTTYYKFN